MKKMRFVRPSIGSYLSIMPRHCSTTPTQATPNQATSPNKNPPFLPSKPLLDVLRSTNAAWKLVQSQPVALTEVLTKNDIAILDEDQWFKELAKQKVTNTKHWASLSAADKTALKLPSPVVMALDTSPEVQQQLFLQFELRTAVDSPTPARPTSRRLVSPKP